MVKGLLILVLIMGAIIFCGCSYKRASQRSEAGESTKPVLYLREDKNSEAISVFNQTALEPILVQNARPNERPYIHPIKAPDGKGIVTQYRPSHHPHQTGIFWGLKMVNGRDHFMKWQGDYFKKISSSIIKQQGTEVQWQTVYDLLDEKGQAVLIETATWTLKIHDGKYLIDLEWKGEAQTSITIGKFYVGGLFVRMPWFKDTPGEVVNANGQRNQEAEAQRALWADVGMAIEGRNDWAHVAIFDHPNNKSFPIPWRVDNEFGIGPSRQIAGDWKLEKGEADIVRYRLVVYTGNRNSDELMRLWREFSCMY